MSSSAPAIELPGLAAPNGCKQVDMSKNHAQIDMICGYVDCAIGFMFSEPIAEDGRAAINY